MPSTYSPNLRIELIASGEQANTWGVTTNNNLGTLIGDAIAGLTDVDVTAADVTLTALDGLQDQARNMMITVSGSPSAARTVFCPDGDTKVYVVANNSTKTITFSTVSGSGVAIPSGTATLVYCDGVDVLESVSAVGPLNVAGTTTLGTGSGSPIVLRISDLSTGDGGAGTWSTTTDFTQLQFYSADASVPGGANPRYSIGAVMANSVGSLSALTFRSWSSGTATERMRLDSSGNLGLGATPSAWAGTAGPALQINKLTIAQNGGFDISVFTTNGYATSGSAYAYIGAAAAAQYRQYAGQHQWFNAPVGAAAGDPITFTQAMTLNASGDLGVGVASPGYRLDLSTGNTTGIATAARIATTGNGGSGRGTGILIGAGGSSNSVDVAQIVGYQNANAATATSAALAFQVANSSAVLTEVARFDNSGNLGLGVTPNASWGTAQTALDFKGNGGVSSYSGGTNSITLSQNAYQNGTAWYYKAATAASAISCSQTSAITFLQAAAGTVGGALSWTQAMTLDASGNLGLGVTPSAWTVIKAIQIGAEAGSGIYADNGTTAVGISSNAYYSTNWKYFSSQEASRYEQAAGTHKWFSAASGTAGNAITFTQAMALDASGNLNISNLTASRALVTDGSKNLASSAVTSTELGYVSGVTSAIQTQLNAKQATITGAATTITSSNLTASRAVVSDASGKIAASSVTSTELGYVSGVTSAIQTQLNNKPSLTGSGASGTWGIDISGNATYATYAGAGQGPVSVTSGTTLITGIPSDVYNIVVDVYNVSQSTTGNWYLQVGNGSIVTTGYWNSNSFTGAQSGFISDPVSTLARAMSFRLTRQYGTNNWSCYIAGTYIAGASNYSPATEFGVISLSGALDRLQLRTSASSASVVAGGTMSVRYW